MKKIYKTREGAEISYSIGTFRCTMTIFLVSLVLSQFTPITTTTWMLIFMGILFTVVAEVAYELSE